MDDLPRAVGAPIPVQWNGSTVLLGGLTLMDFGTISQHLLGQRPDPIAVCKRMLVELPDLSEETREKLTAKAYEDAKQARNVSHGEIVHFLATPDGVAYAIWLCLNKANRQQVTLESVHEVLHAMSQPAMDELQAKLMQVSGIDDRGNSTGRQEAAAAPTAAQPGGNG